MAPIGEISQREISSDTLNRARARAALVPDLLVEAKRVANTVFTGWHGRRKRGIGENFWQFRPYNPGEALAKIDWRRSARDEHNIYVQDKEWQATHTVWIWVDESQSMLFKSEHATVSKHSRALVLAFALSELLARSGERVGWLGLTEPILSRNAAERLAEALTQSVPQTKISDTLNLKSSSEVVLISDFLNPVEETKTLWKNITNLGGRGHAIQIIDPVEETFPYTGRVEFTDPETGSKFTSNNAKSLQSNYEAEFSNHTKELGSLAKSIGWSHISHHTDRLASQALASLHNYLTFHGDL